MDPRRHTRTAAAAPGFTRLEAMVVAMLVALVGVFLVPVSSSARRKSTRIQCVDHLKTLGMAFRLSFDGLTNPPPWQVTPGALVLGGGEAASLPVVRTDAASQYFEYYQALLRAGLDPRVLVCPADASTRVAVKDAADLGRPTVRNRAISWFLAPESDELHPQLVLFGDRSLEASPPLPPFHYRSPNAVRGDLRADPDLLRRCLEWNPTEVHRGEGNLAMADGSVQQLTSDRLRRQFSDARDPQLRHTIIQPGLGPE